MSAFWMVGYYWRHLWPGVAIFFAILVGGVLSCAGPAVIEASRPCSDVGLDNALNEACERWPGSCEVGQRMDFYCVTQAQIESDARCGFGHSDTAIIDHCTMWPGTSQAYRGRMYVGPRDSVADAAFHEAQHWHLWDDVDTNACETHEAACGWIED